MSTSNSFTPANHYLSVLGMGCAVPQHTMSQVQATQMAAELVCENPQHARLTEVIYRRASVQNRHTCVPHRIAYEWKDPADTAKGKKLPGNFGPTTGERMKLFVKHASELAISSASSAISDAAIAAGEITHLVTVSCTGFDAPGIDIDLIRQLGLRADVQRVNVGFMGCHGAINGIRTARGLAAADPDATVLLCATELCSLHYRFVWDPERMMGNALFADGSASLVCRQVTNPTPETWNVVSTDSCLIPESTAEMEWKIGDHGFEMSLTARVPVLIDEHLRPWLSQWLSQHGLNVEDVAAWAIHPGGPRILTAVENSLQLPKSACDTSRQILKNYGNMSSPTVLFILNEMRKKQLAGPCVALGFGPGLVAEAALLV